MGEHSDYNLLSFVSEVKVSDPQSYETLRKKPVIIRLSPDNGKLNYKMQWSNFIMSGASSLNISELEQRIKDCVVDLDEKIAVYITKS